jgi:uncharacterized protein (TIGR03435 family)
MMPALADHLWQSTVFAAGAILLALAFRRYGAEVRYRFWLAASLKFLAPFPLLLALAGPLAWRTTPEAAPAAATAIVQWSEPFGGQLAIGNARSAASGAPAIWPMALALAWLCGFAVVTVRWWASWRAVRAAMRSARPMAIAATVPVLVTQGSLEPGVFGVFRPVLLLPKGLVERLPAAQFQAILRHELCHVRRRDNLAAAIHMAVEAIFWFHPLGWWIGARMVEERERACDEDVLRQGSDPESYATGILQVCRYCVEAPVPCASGVTGADLMERVEDIMSGRVVRGLSTARRAALAAAATLAVAAPVAIGIARAQTQASPLRFDVASIKESKDDGTRGGMNVYPGGGLRMDGATLRSLVAFAYDVREEYVIGGPKWVGSATYDLLAKPEKPSSADNPPGTFAPGTTAWDRMRLRLQTLLAERFQLRVRRDKKEASGYRLVVAKGGSKLMPSNKQEPAGTNRGMGRIEGRSGTMRMLAAVLSGYLGRPVVDTTGLEEGYTYKLEYAQEGSDSALPDVFKALPEQLGLRLEARKVETETIVIERAERAEGN